MSPARGVSGGAVQHHFPTRAEMVLYAMEWTSEQVEQRLSAGPRWGTSVSGRGKIALELHPLDVDRHREHAVWVAFIAHAGTDPKLSDVKRQTNEKLHGMYSRIIRARRELPAPAGVSAASSSAASTGVQMDALLLQSQVVGLSLQLAALELDEAIRVGPRLLDRYLVLAVDGQEGESEQ